VDRHTEEVIGGERFEFGRNWQRLLRIIDEELIAAATQSLQDILAAGDLMGQRLLDIGSGSGLLSLAARRLGASVHSFDYDPQSVGCTERLREIYFPGDPDWSIERASVLDRAHMNSIGKFDIVYSWGVLHHTGDMWQALSNASLPVAANGKLCVAIYNDQGSASRRWLKVKRFYCSGRFGKISVIGFFFPYFFISGMCADLLRGKNPARRYAEHRNERGMPKIWDWVDWLGGYPFETAKPEEIFDFYRKSGFLLEHLRTCGGGLGNYEFLFVRNDSGSAKRER